MRDAPLLDEAVIWFMDGSHQCTRESGVWWPLSIKYNKWGLLCPGCGTPMEITRGEVPPPPTA